MEQWACHVVGTMMERAFLKLPDSLQTDLVRGKVLLEHCQLVPAILPGLLSCTVGKLEITVSWHPPRALKVELSDVLLLLGPPSEAHAAQTLPHITLPNQLWRDALSSVFGSLDLQISGLSVRLKGSGDQPTVGMVLDNVSVRPAIPRLSLCQMLCGKAASPSSSVQMSGSFDGLTVYTEPAVLEAGMEAEAKCCTIPSTATKLHEPLGDHCASLRCAMPCYAALRCAVLTVLLPGGVLSLMLHQEPGCALQAVWSVCVCDRIALQLSRSQAELLADATQQLMQLMVRWKLNIHASAGSNESTELQPELELLESLLDDDWEYNYDDEEDNEESSKAEAAENTQVNAAALRCVPCSLYSLLPDPCCLLCLFIRSSANVECH